MCAHYDVSFPTVEMIEQKKKDVDAALNYEYKEEDIEKIVQEKARFRGHPTNYAMRKTELMKVGLALSSCWMVFNIESF